MCIGGCVHSSSSLCITMSTFDTAHVYNFLFTLHSNHVYFYHFQYTVSCQLISQVFPPHVFDMDMSSNFTNSFHNRKQTVAELLCWACCLTIHQTDNSNPQHIPQRTIITVSCFLCKCTIRNRTKIMAFLYMGILNTGKKLLQKNLRFFKLWKQSKIMVFNRFLWCLQSHYLVAQ